MKTVPDWTIEGSWWVSGIFATGGVWYFLSAKNVGGVVVAAVGALLFAGVAIVLHRRKDAASEPAAAAGAQDTPAEEFARRYTDQPSHIRFLKALPRLRSVVYENAQEGWDTGVTADMREASYDVIDFLEFAWLRLADFLIPLSTSADRTQERSCEPTSVTGSCTTGRSTNREVQARVGLSSES